MSEELIDEAVEEEVVEDKVAEDPDFPGQDPDDVALLDALKDSEVSDSDNIEVQNTETVPDSEKVADEIQKNPAVPAIDQQEKFDAAILEAKQNAAYWQGQAQANAELLQKNNQANNLPEPVEPVKNAYDHIADIRKKITDNAAKFDDGDISSSDLHKEMFILQDQEREIQQIIMQENLSKQQKAEPGDTGDNLYLQDQTRALNVEFPYVEMIKNPAQWQMIESEARGILNNSGVQLLTGDAGALQVRRKMAEVATYYGPAFTGKNLPQDENKQPEKNYSTNQEREAKLNLAAQHPANINTMGNAGNILPEVTESQIETMSDDDIEALPASVRQKLMKDV